MRNSWWLVYLALVTACGDDGLTAPSPTSITVTGSDLLLVGASETFTAAGNTGVITGPRWGSDAPSVAAVDPATGRVTAVGTGTATIYADANGIRGTKLIRTLPNFEGVWVLEYRLTRCESIQPDICRALPLYMELKLGQNREGISGQFHAWDYDSFDQFKSNNVAGSVAADGTLSFTADANSSSGSSHTLQMQNVRFELRNEKLTGSFEQVWSWEGLRGLTVPLRAFFELTETNRIQR